MYSSSHFFNDCGVKLKFTAGEKALKWPIGAGDLVGGLFSLSASPKFKKKKKKWGGDAGAHLLRGCFRRSRLCSLLITFNPLKKPIV